MNRAGTNIWSVPSIYATLPDGRLAPGCRAIESLRVPWDLANMPENLQSARDRVRQGVLLSSISREPRKEATSSGSISFVVGHTFTNPSQMAQRHYIAVHGSEAFGSAVKAMIDCTLA
jgi:hypothetical protein